MTETETPPTEEKVLSKAERRLKIKRDQYIEYLQKQATKTHNELCARFNEYLIFCDDPTEENLRKKAKQFSAQWKLYCKQKNLKDTVLNLVGDFCEKTIAEFLALQEVPKETTSIPTPEKVLESAKEDKLI